MENLDAMVLRTLQGWRAAGQRALLATVVRTWGSSPRPEGSIMALCETGAVVGSVSGGCIEDDLIDRYTRAYAGSGQADGWRRARPAQWPASVCQVRRHCRRGAPFWPAVRRHAGAAARI